MDSTAGEPALGRGPPACGENHGFQALCGGAGGALVCRGKPMPVGALMPVSRGGHSSIGLVSSGPESGGRVGSAKSASGSGSVSSGAGTSWSSVGLKAGGLIRGAYGTIGCPVRGSIAGVCGSGIASR